MVTNRQSLSEKEKMVGEIDSPYYVIMNMVVAVQRVVGITMKLKRLNRGTQGWWQNEMSTMCRERSNGISC